MPRVKYLIGKKRYMMIDVEDEQVELVKELNRDMERYIKSDFRFHQRCIVADNIGYIVPLVEDQYELIVDKMIKEEKKKALIAAIKSLKKSQREIIIGMFYEDKTMTDISNETGRSLSSICRSYNRAIGNLKKKLKDFG